MNYSIAIDGPAGVGKSTIAKRLAEQLGYTYVDTGAMYRALAVFFLDQGLKPEDESGISKALDLVDVNICYRNGEQRMLVNGIDVTDRLRSQEVSHMTSVTSQYAPVREKLKQLQRSLSEKQSVIMDGRDIGTVILPDATLKVYLTARPEVRAERRYLQNFSEGRLGESTRESILKELMERDYRDSHRANAPLKKADDAVPVDTSDLTMEGVEEVILKELAKKIGN